MDSEPNITPDSGARAKLSPSRKEQLEIEKLEAEISKVNAEHHRLTDRRWVLVSICASALPIVAALTGVTIAACGLIVPWKLGTYNVAEQRIKLDLQKLEDKRSSLNGDVNRLIAERKEFEAERVHLTNQIVRLTNEVLQLSVDRVAKEKIIDDFKIVIAGVVATNQLLKPLQIEVERLEAERDLARKFVAVLDRDRDELYAGIYKIAETHSDVFTFLKSFKYGRPNAPQEFKLRAVTPSN